MMEIPLDKLLKGIKARIDVRDLLALLDESTARSSSSTKRAARLQPKKSADPALSAAEMLALGRGEVSVTEAAELLGMSRQAVLAAIKRSALTARQIGKMFVVDVASISGYHRRSPRATRTKPRL